MAEVSPELKAGPTVPPEKIARFTSYIDQGGVLIKEGKFSDAMEHFQNADELAVIGKHLDPSPRTIFTQVQPKPERYASLADQVASYSWSKEGGMVEISTIHYFAIEPEGTHMKQLPPELAHEIALIHMEEWLHCLQDILQASLTGQKSHGLDAHEIDIAVYMKKHDIPMTEAFLRRYGRKEALAKMFP